MGQLVQQAIVGLQDIQAAQDGSNDSIWIAGDLLARYHTRGGFKSGFPHIDAEPVTAEDAAQLKHALLAALEQSTSIAAKGSILTALRHTRDATLKLLYVAYLEEAQRLMEDSSCLIFACLDCLEHLGEDAFERDEAGNSSQSAVDFQKNWRQARAYLQRLNSAVPLPLPLMDQQQKAP